MFSGLYDRLSRLVIVLVLPFLLFGLVSATAHAQAVDGKNPVGALAFAPDGNFYGTTSAGGAGTVFRMDSAGHVTTLHSFTGAGTDGSTPWSAVTVTGAPGSLVLYGTTKVGGAHGIGTLFKLVQSGTGFTFSTLYSFAGGVDGSNPYARLLLVGTNDLYGTAANGGAYGAGTVFDYNVSANVLTTRYAFTGGSDGATPVTGLLASTDGLGHAIYYGTTEYGGTSNYGTLFKLDASNHKTILHAFAGTTDGAYAASSLLLSSDGNLYSTCYSGGASNKGTFWKCTVGATPTFTTLHSFTGSTTDGSNPGGGVVSLASGGTTYYYGTTQNGGSANDGTIYKWDGTTFTNAYSFTGSDGAQPSGELTADTSALLWGVAYNAGAYGYGTAYKVVTGYLPIHSFGGTLPTSGLSISPSTVVGGATPTGTVTLSSMVSYPVVVALSSPSGAVSFPSSVTVPANTASVPFTISTTAGASTTATLTASLNDALGAANLTIVPTNVIGLALAPASVTGGKSSVGTVTLSQPAPAGGSIVSLSSSDTSIATVPVSVGVTAGQTSANFVVSTTTVSSSKTSSITASLSGTATGVLTVHPLMDGTNPTAGLLYAPDGYYYGTTSGGGANGNGTVFRTDANGNITIVYDFSAYDVNSYNLDGGAPRDGLVLGPVQSNGAFILYGAAFNGGSVGKGTIFQISGLGSTPTTVPAFTVLHSFSSTEGAHPSGQLVYLSGDLYGTTESGGASSNGVVYKCHVATMAMTTLHSFQGAMDGATPRGGLLISTDASGNTIFYGVTAVGGSSSDGVVYKMDLAGNLTVLHTFTGANSDGAQPFGTPIQAVDGTLYGTSNLGGTNSLGTVWSLTTGATPTFTTVHSFAGTDGSNPSAGLTEVSDQALLYGVTVNGGTSSKGVVFSLDTSNSLAYSVAFSFADTDGANPYGPFCLDGGGGLWGTTKAGGANTTGGIFQVADSSTLLHSFGAILPLLSGPPVVTPTVAANGGQAIGTINLSTAAPSGGTTVTLTSGTVTVPSSLVIPAGAISANFTMTTPNVSGTQAASIQATSGNVNNLVTFALNSGVWPPPQDTGDNYSTGMYTGTDAQHLQYKIEYVGSSINGTHDIGPGFIGAVFTTASTQHPYNVETYSGLTQAPLEVHHIYLDRAPTPNIDPYFTSVVGVHHISQPNALLADSGLTIQAGAYAQAINGMVTLTSTAYLKYKITCLIAPGGRRFSHPIWLATGGYSSAKTGYHSYNMGDPPNNVFGSAFAGPIASLQTNTGVTAISVAGGAVNTSTPGYPVIVRGADTYVACWLYVKPGGTQAVGYFYVPFYPSIILSDPNPTPVPDQEDGTADLEIFPYHVP